jgi:hypothetical protein
VDIEWFVKCDKTDADLTIIDILTDYKSILDSLIGKVKYILADKAVLEKKILSN